MKIEQDVRLDNLTTFKIGGKASYFALVKNIAELKEAVESAQKQKLPWFVLGGGSNILVDDAGFEGLVIKNEITGTTFEDQGNEVRVIAGAGENWDDLVRACVERGLYGLENLSGIPGTVGAAPVQNIGAYGVEVKDSLVSVEVFNTETLQVETLDSDQCAFTYRDSIFKKPEGRKYIITAVTCMLTREPRLHIEYKDVENYFVTKKITPTLETVRTAIIEIRKGKFPDLRTHGTAGSFFKNPIISKKEYAALLERYPQMPKYDVDDAHVKIPLAWIIDNVCQAKGVRRGNVGQFERQALVLVNFGGATAKEVKEHAAEIIDRVREKTGIIVEPEVHYL